MRQPTKSIDRVWIVVVLGLVAYTLPWVTNECAALTAGAYDLAEWASLTPDGRDALPLYLPTILLRLQLVIFAWMLAANIPQRVLGIAWLVSAAGVVALAAALLPPLEFFVRSRSDSNYQQQLGLSLGALVGGLALFSRRAYTVRRWITGGLALVGLVTTAVGLLQVQALMQQYQLIARIGTGGVLLVLVYGVLIYSLVVQVWENKRGSNQSTPPHEKPL